jgi:hypothetical protein
MRQVARRGQQLTIRAFRSPILETLRYVERKHAWQVRKFRAAQSFRAGSADSSRAGTRSGRLSILALGLSAAAHWACRAVPGSA